jgi:outer membrane protein OmpA-like peptidoglycan-associated protein
MRRRFLPLITSIVLLGGSAATAFAQSNGPLLQPGEPFPGTQQEPVHLHPPVHHKQPATTVSPTPTENTGSESTQSGSPPVATNSEAAPQIDLIHPPRHKAKPKPAPQIVNIAPPAVSPRTSEPESVPFSFSGTNPAGKPASERPPATVKSGSHSPAGEHANLSKRGTILFERGEPSPSPAQYHGVKVLADDLNAQLEKGAAGIQLEAYGGAPGDKSSDARRLSLRRALAVRQLLIDDGVPSARIDVRAMGGSDDGNQADRVDVFVRTG